MGFVWGAGPLVLAGVNELGKGRDNVMGEQEKAEYGSTPNQRLTDRVQDHEFRIATLASSVIAICDEVKGVRADVRSDIKELHAKIEAQVTKAFTAIETHTMACAAKAGVEENRKEIVILKVFNGKILGIAAAISGIIGLGFQLLFWVITKKAGG
jgi:hypothetical protein